MLSERATPGKSRVATESADFRYFPVIPGLDLSFITETSRKC